MRKAKISDRFMWASQGMIVIHLISIVNTFFENFYFFIFHFYQLIISSQLQIDFVNEIEPFFTYFEKKIVACFCKFKVNPKLGLLSLITTFFVDPKFEVEKVKWSLTIQQQSIKSNYLVKVKMKSTNRLGLQITKVGKDFPFGFTFGHLFISSKIVSWMAIKNFDKKCILLVMIYDTLLSLTSIFRSTKKEQTLKLIYKCYLNPSIYIKSKHVHIATTWNSKVFVASY